MSKSENGPRRGDNEFGFIKALGDWAVEAATAAQVEPDSLQGAGVHLFRCPVERVKQFFHERGRTWNEEHSNVVPLMWVASADGLITSRTESLLTESDLDEFIKAMESARASKDPEAAFRTLTEDPIRFLKAVA